MHLIVIVPLLSPLQITLATTGIAILVGNDSIANVVVAIQAPSQPQKYSFRHLNL
jgi:hypothetical protein